MSTQQKHSEDSLLTSKPFFVFLFVLGLLLLIGKTFEDHLNLYLASDLWVFGTVFTGVGGLMLIPDKWLNSMASPSVQPEQKDDSSNPDRS